MPITGVKSGSGLVCAWLDLSLLLTVGQQQPFFCWPSVQPVTRLLLSPLPPLALLTPISCHKCGAHNNHNAIFFISITNTGLRQVC